MQTAKVSFADRDSAVQAEAELYSCIATRWEAANQIIAVLCVLGDYKVRVLNKQKEK